MENRLNAILSLLESGQINTEEAFVQILGLFAINKDTIEVISWMAECPYNIDTASIPKAGIEVAPQQVVGTLSLNYLKYKQLCAVADMISDVSFFKKI